MRQVNMGRYPVAGSGPDCKSGALQLGWFESNPAHHPKNDRKFFGKRCDEPNNFVLVLSLQTAS